MDNTTEDPDLNASEPKRTLGRFAIANITKNSEGKILYGCRECPAKYIMKQMFERHLCTHYNEYRYICSICGVGLKRREHLERHTQGHLQVRPFSCPECNKAFKRKEHLNIHMSIHMGDKHMKCSFCNKSFYRKDHLRKHLMTHNRCFVKQNVPQVGDEDLEIKLEPVEESDDDQPSITDIKTEIDLENVKLDSGENPEGANDTMEALPERPYTCDLCFKTFKKESHLKVHSYSHFKNECVECAKAFSSPEELVAHVGSEHADCSSDQLDNDLLVERTIPETRPHECPVCHKTFKRKQHLKTHSNVHNKQATVWCSLCNQGFYTNEQYDGHKCVMVGSPDNVENRGHSKGTGGIIQNDYPMKILQETELEIEDRQLPDEQGIPKPVRVYVCKYCTKPFRRKDHYKIHLNIHTGDKFFFCEDCGKGFYRRDHMQKHALVHNKGKQAPKPKSFKKIPDLYPIDTAANKSDVKPEITIHAPSNTKLRVPLQIKVPYKMVMSLDNGEQRAVTINPAQAITS